MTSSVRIVLVETTHGGNIGAAARAMKTMGLHALYLVRPCKYLTYEALARASGANAVLEQAVVCDSLAEAVAGCTRVYGCSARKRSLHVPLTEPDVCAGEICAAPAQETHAVVFGRERSGLTNDELDLCQSQVYIPADPSFSSLNLAAAVQVIAYEIRRHSLQEESSLPPAVPSDTRDETLATADQLDGLVAHFRQTMIDVAFLDPQNPRLLIPKLRRLFLRSELSSNEINILRGFLAAVNKSVK